MPIKRSYFLTLNFITFLCKKQGFFAVIQYKKENRRNGADLVKFQFVALFKSAQPGSDHHCHCEERSDVAISWYIVCWQKPSKYRTISIGAPTLLLGQSMDCTGRLPRRGVAPPRNDTEGVRRQQPSNRPINSNFPKGCKKTHRRTGAFLSKINRTRSAGSLLAHSSCHAVTGKVHKTPPFGGVLCY